MKRDMDLVREILIALSEANEPINASVFTSDRFDYELVAYHFQIMDEAGLIEAKFLRADGFWNSDILTGNQTDSYHNDLDGSFGTVTF